MIGMPTGFWGGWIAVVTVVTLVALAWLVISVYFAPDDSAEIAGETWDETLREGTTPAPLWWFWLILALLAVSVVYLMLYPGLGGYRGALDWSQGGQVAASEARYEERFGPRRREIAETAVAELAADAAAMESAANVFATHCAACHGATGGGQAQQFPRLTDGDWQWGGSEQQVAETLTLGRQATMPPWQGVLGEQGVGDVAAFVLAMSQGNGAADEVARGREAFQLYCSACHGSDGAGLPALGAPALNDDIWLYGGTPADVRRSIAEGRNGQMPAFGERLDAAQIRLLVAWLARGRFPSSMSASVRVMEE